MQSRAWARGPLKGAVVGLTCVAAVSGVLLPFRDSTSTATDALALVLPCVIAAWIGGRVPALLTAAAAAVTLNIAFLEPYGNLKIDVVEDAVALGVFAAVALVVGTLVALESGRRAVAEERAVKIQALYDERRSLEAGQERLAAEKRALELASEYRSALMRSVSHDLRTPLATIRAIASDLQSGTEYDRATRAELLDLVSDEADRLDRLVANLLSLSRIEAGSLAPDRQAVPLDELLTDRARKLKRVLSDVRLQVDVPFTLPLADADYTLLDQVVTNLLDNAARHSPPDGTVRVRARERSDNGERWIEVAVSDQGPGVEPADRERIFEPFLRGKESTSSGVGLAICKAIVEAHGGTIHVEGANGGGAQFVFTLPVHR